MRLQIVSDVHLEYRKGRYPHIPRLAKHIALLGDIGRPHTEVYRKFIDNLSRRFETVIIIAGNHEFYSTRKHLVTVPEVHQKLQSFHRGNVHYLERDEMMIEGVRILGCSLWTHIPNDKMRIVQKKMNDYRMVYLTKYVPEAGVFLHPRHTSFWHARDRAWLEAKLHTKTPTIVLTHHAPYHLNTSAPEYTHNHLQCCYATDLSHMFTEPVKAWAFGHTHWPSDQQVKGVRVVSNPLGYPHEKVPKHENVVIEI